MVDAEEGEGSKCDWRPDLWSQTLKLRIDPGCLLTRLDEPNSVLYAQLPVTTSAAEGEYLGEFFGLVGSFLEGRETRIRIEVIKAELRK